MGSPELAKMADFYADLTGRFALTDSLALWRDSSERLHQLVTEPEDVTSREVTANGVPALWVIPAGSSPEHVLLLGQGYDPSRIASIGGSIGGNYAVNLALTLQRKNAPLPWAVLSMSPWFDMELKHKSIETNASLDKMLSGDLLRGFSDSMLDGTGIAKTDPRINLAYADPAGLPPTMIYYGENEILTDDAIEFAARARVAGVDLELRSLPEGQHIFYLGAGRVPEIDAAVAEMAAWLRSKIGLAPA
jgi:epsilon-lactone hydrolase